jgi:inner membrane protein
MPTLFTHGAIGFIAGKVATEATAPNTRLLVASMALSALPDADALFISVIPYNHPFGHRGLTHSLFFAAIIGLLVALLFSKADWAPRHSFWFLALVFAVTTASHGFFDAMTDGGLGIAFFAPFNNARYFFPWRPIPVAPLSLEGLMSGRGLRVIRWELAMFWTFALGAFVWDRKTIWRIALAVLCAAIGTVMWVLAMNL